MQKTYREGAVAILNIKTRSQIATHLMFTRGHEKQNYMLHQAVSTSNQGTVDLQLSTQIKYHVHNGWVLTVNMKEIGLCELL